MAAGIADALVSGFVFFLLTWIVGGFARERYYKRDPADEPDDAWRRRTGRLVTRDAAFSGCAFAVLTFLFDIGEALAAGVTDDPIAAIALHSLLMFAAGFVLAGAIQLLAVPRSDDESVTAWRVRRLRATLVVAAWCASPPVLFALFRALFRL
jgi:hypothetical protein